MIYITVVLSFQVHIIIVWWVSFLNLWLRQASIYYVCILPLPPPSFFPPSIYPPLPWWQCSVIVWGCSSIVLLFCLVTGSCRVAQASLELGILLLQPPKHWTCGLASLLSDAVPQVWLFRFLCSCCFGASFYLGPRKIVQALTLGCVLTWGRGEGALLCPLYMHTLGFTFITSNAILLATHLVSKGAENGHFPGLQHAQLKCL